MTRKGFGHAVGVVAGRRVSAGRADVAVADAAAGAPAMGVVVPPDTRPLRLLLTLMALHSFLTGVGLLAQPDFLLRWGGWGEVRQAFFPAQGGVFHMLMAVLYVKALRPGSARTVLLRFIILVKAVAALFLLTYYVAVESIWLVALSGVGDGVMAMMVWFFGRKERGSDDTGTL